MNTQIEGRVVRGLRAASGASRLPRRGTIALQLPYFRARLPEFDSFFDARLHPATLNVEVPRHHVIVGCPSYYLTKIRWERGTTENFYLSPCTLSYAGHQYRGLIYIPDPATKPAGLPVGQVLEVLTIPVPFIRYGARVSLAFEISEVMLIRTPPRSHGHRGPTPCVTTGPRVSTPSAILASS